MIRYPVAIEVGGQDHAWGVVVADLPGCFSAGDTLEAALDGAREAIAAWVDEVLDSGEPIPPPSPLETVLREHSGGSWIIALVEIDDAAFDDRPERVNISLPRRVLARLDALAQSSGSTRSGWIAAQTLRGQKVG